MRTILIGTSKFGNPVSDYYKSLGDTFIKNNYRVVYIFDGLFYDYPKETKKLKFYTWKSKRPTKLTDFVFFYKLLKKEEPILCISNFGSTNIISIVSFLIKIKYRINYIHTTSIQLNFDSKNSFYKKFLKFRKMMIYLLNTHFFTNSEGNKKDAILYYGLKKEQIVVLPLLIKKSNIAYRKFDEREKCICLVGRLHPSKGHVKFLHLFANCLKSSPDLKLKIIGDGYLKEALVLLTKKLKIEDNVIFTGRVSNKEINELFSSSLVSISSSIDEAYGLVNIEALREGTPLVCTRTAGSKDILEVGKNGEFIDLNDKSSLKLALDKVLNNWQTYSNYSIESFTSKYDFLNVELHYKRLVDIINSNCQKGN